MVLLARSLKVRRGRQRRIDGRVVRANSPHPTASPLLYDGVRVLSRRVVKATQVLQETTVLARSAFRERTRSAKRQRKRLMEAARQRGAQVEARLRTASQRLLTSTAAMVKQAGQGGAVLIAQGAHTGPKLATTWRQFVPVVHQVIIQTTRRSSPGEVGPAPETVVRLVEPHPASIRKGKAGNPTEFGRVIWWDEVEGGILSRYAVLEGHPAEDAHLPPSLEPPRQVFQRPPRLLAGDRGVPTTANERYAILQGVAQVVWPKSGANSAQRMAHERQRWFRRGHNGRSGMAGRISGLTRRHQLDRCRYHGRDGMERWVGWGVSPPNLRVMAQAAAHEPTGEAIQPCHGPRCCQTLGRPAVSQRVVHHNLG